MYFSSQHNVSAYIVIINADQLKLGDLVEYYLSEEGKQDG